MVMSPAALDSFVAIFRFGAAAGARAIGATDAAAANEPRGRRRRPPGSKAAQTGCRRRALSPTFPAGEPDQPPLLKLCLQRVRFQRTSTRQRLDCAKTQLLCSQENRRIPTFDGLLTCNRSTPRSHRRGQEFCRNPTQPSTNSRGSGFRGQQR